MSLSRPWDTYYSRSSYLEDPFFINMADVELPFEIMKANTHPSFLQLIILVLAAVLEVVCVSLPGYIIARQGMFDAESQKFLANLNIMLFTPCLIFTKIASQLTPEKLPELAIIPVIFVIQTLVSYAVSTGVSKAFKLKKRPQYFVTAMGVFGNSNSLPISLVISLSKTIPSLRWDKIPGDNSEEVAARGILYLMIFQQLGQFLRWSWGYHYLLAKPETFKVSEGGTLIDRLEHGEDTHETTPLLITEDYDAATEDTEDSLPDSLGASRWPDSGSLTPPNGQINSSSSSATLDELNHSIRPKPDQRKSLAQVHPLPNGEIHGDDGNEGATKWTSPKSILKGTGAGIASAFRFVKQKISGASSTAYSTLPTPVQNIFNKIGSFMGRFLTGLWEFMNPPLWAMLAAVVVASIPELQHYFFHKGTFINTSITRAVDQSGGVAVPLILVVLGANLARNTLSPEQRKSINDDDEGLEKKLLIASLVSRMLLPTLIMAPILAIFAKFVPVSILDDPVFVVVAFLLTGAPSALQLAQICQLNNVYVPTMTSLLFQSYVIWILPSTLILVMAAIEVVKWADTDKL